MRTLSILTFSLILFLSQLSCKSGENTNAPANANAPVPQQGPTIPAIPAGSVVPNPIASPGAGPKATDTGFSELVMLYSELFTARVKNDRAKLDRLLANDYKETNASGKTLNKAQVLAALNPNQKVDMYQLDDLRATSKGDTGSVTGTAGVTRAGQTESWQFTTTFKKSGGQWIATFSRLGNETAGPKPGPAGAKRVTDEKPK